MSDGGRMEDRAFDEEVHNILNGGDHHRLEAEARRARKREETLSAVLRGAVAALELRSEPCERTLCETFKASCSTYFGEAERDRMMSWCGACLRNWTRLQALREVRDVLL